MLEERKNYDVRMEKCKLHPDKFLTSICLTQTCTNKLLCVLCLKDHNKWHSCYNAIEDIISEKHITNGDELLKSFETGQVVRKWDRFFTVTGNIIKEFEEFLQGYKKKFHHYVSDYMCHSASDTLTKFKSSHQILHSCLDNFAKDGIHLHSKIDEYAAAYENVQNLTKDLKKEQHQSSSKIKDLSCNIESYLNELRLRLEGSINIQSSMRSSVLKKPFLFPHEEEEKHQENWQIDIDRLQLCKKLPLNQDKESESYDHGICLIEEDNLLVTGGIGEIYLTNFDPEKPQKVVKTESSMCINEIKYLKEKSLLVTCSKDYLLTIWDYALDMRCIGQHKFSDEVYTIEYNEQDERLICGGFFPDLYILSLEGLVQGRLETDNVKNFGAITCVPKKNFVAACSVEDGTIWIFDWIERKLRGKLTAHAPDKDIGCFKYDSKKGFLYSCGGDGKILVWKIDEMLPHGKPFKEFHLEHNFIAAIFTNCLKEGDFVTLCQNNDGTYLVFWNIESEKPRDRKKVFNDPAYTMICYHNKKQILVKSSKSADLIVLEEPAPRTWWGLW